MNGQEGQASQSQVLTIDKTPQRAFRHLRTFGQIAGVAIIAAILYLVFGQESGIAGRYGIYVQWLTLIGGAFAIWWLIRDWLMTGNMTYLFDANRQEFRIQYGNRTPLELSFKAIKRIKIEESSNVFPVYTLFIHLQDGQAIEIDASADQAEIDMLANQISQMTGTEIVTQRYDEPLSEEEREDRRRQRNQIYRGD